MRDDTRFDLSFLIGGQIVRVDRHDNLYVAKDGKMWIVQSGSNDYGMYFWEHHEILEENR